jgi:hypothetical protein
MTQVGQSVIGLVRLVVVHYTLELLLGKTLRALDGAPRLQ